MELYTQHGELWQNLHSLQLPTDFPKQHKIMLYIMFWILLLRFWQYVIILHHHPILIRFFLVSEGGRMYLIPSAIALTPSLHLARSVASSTLNPIFFKLSSLVFSRSALAVLAFAVHSLEASLPSSKCSPPTSGVLQTLKKIRTWLRT